MGKLIDKFEAFDYLKDELDRGKKIRPVELKKGMISEREHTETIAKLIHKLAPGLDSSTVKSLVKDTIKNIAEDHLKDISDYYTKLQKYVEKGTV